MTENSGLPDVIRDYHRCHSPTAHGSVTSDV